MICVQAESQEIESSIVRSVCAKRIPECPARAVATVGEGRAADELRQALCEVSDDHGADPRNDRVGSTRCVYFGSEGPDSEDGAVHKAYEDAYSPQHGGREGHKKPPRMHRIHVGVLNDDSSQDMKICNAIIGKKQ
ncbi:uncharacterized protein PHALS_01859 [Plasmopara halstedii]|uniref:Uncharacterized protein n=1 Tax=Plasmopara halstedii TaxID=4781 RepID=A0A0P1AWE1_PLAHL|nr:uncharacterized protein PHALS_01859 [Plasmopara halstedii]CEG45573.1 hypothetical protein PHALS_01859 [Plasmopara halstedii]|eukprot:XP_024581942.1 hypothetical protein PHALS_01859 [Plasmopara halstedii]